MIDFFVKHPTASNIIMVAIIAIGLVSLPTLNRETFPNIKSDKVLVQVTYPGASPGEIEEGICSPLEDATDGISFLEEQKCQASDSMGTLTVTMQEQGDMRQFIDDVQSAVDSITNFPDDAEDPLVEEVGRTDKVVSVAIAADLPRDELKALAESYRLKLLALLEVPVVAVTGFSEHELTVNVKAETLRAYQLTVQDLADRIQQQAVDLPLGVLNSTHTDYQLRYLNRRRTIAELEDLVIFNSELGGEIRLGELAEIRDEFASSSLYSELNGQSAALLEVSKNSSDDTLRVFHAVKALVDAENQRLPDSVKLVITEDAASVVEDRLQLLVTNGWQGLLLATAVLFLFFNWRYTFWIAVGLPIAFMGGLALMMMFGVTINMISMVALLMAIGILMDDAMVISESIASESSKVGPNGNQIEAVILGVKRVGKGLISSFATSVMLFGSLLFLAGETGQVMRVLPIVLLSVLTVSLIEAFLVLPAHLSHSLAHTHGVERPNWRRRFDAWFLSFRNRFVGLARVSIRYRYLVVGGVIALFIFSVSMLFSGVLKFKFFPDLEGNILQARIMLSQGTPKAATQEVVDQLLESLVVAKGRLAPEPHGELVKHIKVDYGQNVDAGHNGAHLATITLDLLSTELRVNSLNTLRSYWLEETPPIPEAVAIQFKEPTLGPAGQAISIRIMGDDLDQLSEVSWKLRQWFSRYDGVSNVMDDLLPGKPQLILQRYEGALNSGVPAISMANQVRAAYEGVKVEEIYHQNEGYTIKVKLATEQASALDELRQLPILNSTGQLMPLDSLASIHEQREYGRITRINHIRTVSVTGDIDASIANTEEVIRDARERFLPALLADYPDITISFEGEVKNQKETNDSMMSAFMLAILGVFLLLALQFGNYKEPLIVMINIPLAFIGVIWGHLLMGLDLTMPSMIGFISLAGVVVNDSILLVEYIKSHRARLSIDEATTEAVRDRFRAIFLTSITTVAGLFPLLLETSLQAQVLVPLVTSVVFGMISSTILILIVLPASYHILNEWRIASELASKNDLNPV